MYVVGAVHVVVVVIGMVVVPVAVIVVTVHRLVVVIVVILVVVVLSLVAVAVVVVLLERAALAQRPPHQARRVGESDHAGVPGEDLHRPGERGLHRVADHEDDIGILQRRRVGGTHGEGVRRRVTPDDQVRLAHAGHHGAHQRMHRLDRGNDPQPVVARRRAGGCAAEERRCGEHKGEASWYDRWKIHGRVSVIQADMVA